MKYHIGGLFKTQENANLAYEALQKAGFTSEDLTILVHKPQNTSVRSNNVKIKEIAISAAIGALIVSTLGAFLGLMIGRGEIAFPGLQPGSIPANPLFVMSAVIAGIIFGVLTGAILGTAARLVMSREKAEIVSMGIDQGGLLVIAGADDPQNQNRGRRILEENGALEVGDPSEKWDVGAWLSPNKLSPSMRDLLKTK